MMPDTLAELCNQAVRGEEEAARTAELGRRCVSRTVPLRVTAGALRRRAQCWGRPPCAGAPWQQGRSADQLRLIGRSKRTLRVVFGYWSRPLLLPSLPCSLAGADCRSPLGTGTVATRQLLRKVEQNRIRTR